MKKIIVLIIVVIVAFFVSERLFYAVIKSDLPLFWKWVLLSS